jgi:23S rRNA (adenine-N6)-dimethyltransferase
VSGYGHRPRHSRRSWGWHPLDDAWARRIVETTEVRHGELVLDLGAGRGALTAPLLDAGARVLAVELHPAPAERLRTRFPGRAVTVVEADLADVYWPGRPFRVVASPPYTGATALVRRLLTARPLVAADLLLQRSAAQRLVSERPGGDRWTLSLGMPVPRRAFSPPPRTDSVVLQVRRRARRGPGSPREHLDRGA